jgi:iron complex outermembrane receptor protein
MGGESTTSYPLIKRHVARHSYRYAGFLCASLLAFVPVAAQAQTPNPVTTLPPVQVDAAHKRQPKKPSAAKRTARAADRVTSPAVAEVTAADSNSLNAGNSGPALQQTPSLGKTGTKLADLPVSVQIINRDVINQQGTTTLRDAVNNASGINFGGQDSLGYFDHFLIRGLNAQVYTDGFSDGDQLGGLSHSLNGVQRIEILEGPGSALFGSGPPGGTINVVHYEPSSTFHYGTSVQAGSYGTLSNSTYVTGPTTIDGLNYRLDSYVARADGFRDLGYKDYEFRPEFSWHIGDHTLTASLDVRHLDQTPDSYGLIYSHGSPITNVPIDAKYSTPFSFAKQDFVRPTISDKWEVNNILTINNRFAYTHRDIDVMRNNDSFNTHIVGDTLVGRQLRSQNDSDNNFDYQFEPVWKFAVDGVRHTDRLRSPTSDVGYG